MEMILTWKWYQIGKHLKANWRRHQSSVIAKKRRQHLEWVSECPVYHKNVAIYSQMEQHLEKMQAQFWLVKK